MFIRYIANQKNNLLEKTLKATFLEVCNNEKKVASLSTSQKEIIKMFYDTYYHQFSTDPGDLYFNNASTDKIPLDKTKFFKRREEWWKYVQEARQTFRETSIDQYAASLTDDDEKVEFYKKWTQWMMSLGAKKMEKTPKGKDMMYSNIKGSEEFYIKMDTETVDYQSKKKEKQVRALQRLFNKVEGTPNILRKLWAWARTEYSTITIPIDERAAQLTKDDDKVEFYQNWTKWMMTLDLKKMNKTQGGKGMMYYYDAYGYGHQFWIINDDEPKEKDTDMARLKKRVLQRLFIKVKKTTPNILSKLVAWATETYPGFLPTTTTLQMTEKGREKLVQA